MREKKTKKNKKNKNPRPRPHHRRQARVGGQEKTSTGVLPARLFYTPRGRTQKFQKESIPAPSSPEFNSRFRQETVTYEPLSQGSFPKISRFSTNCPQAIRSWPVRPSRGPRPRPHHRRQARVGGQQTASLVQWGGSTLTNWTEFQPSQSSAVRRDRESGRAPSPYI